MFEYGMYEHRLFAASCRELRAGGLCSPEPRRARYSEVGVCVDVSAVALAETDDPG